MKNLQPYGVWKVTTEGDCEGRSIKQLGIHEGYVDEIALCLADKNSYSLEFTRVAAPQKLELYSPVCGETTITVHNESEIYGALSLADLQTMFEGRPVTIKKSNYYKSVKLTSTNFIEVKRKEALAKLTKKERILLGLA